MSAIALLVLWPVLTFRAQQETDLGEEARRSARALADARGAYQKAAFTQAILVLNRLLDRLGPAAPGTLPMEEEQIRVEALRIRGISYYNLGQLEAAAADFSALLRIEPAFELDRSLLSPKIVKAFEAARQRVTGRLAVKTDPPGADVFLGSRLLGTTPMEPVRVASGRYLFRVEKRGFEEAQERLEIPPGETMERTLALARNARNVNVMTVPAGARVFVDGKEVGTTSGVPPPGYEAILLDRGLDPSRASAPLTIPFVAVGEHVVRVEKDCYATLEADITVDLDGSDLPLELEPIALERSVASARFESSPSGAQLIINGEPKGTTPVEVENLCAGRLRVRMEKAGVGRWLGEVDLAAGARRTVRHELRLALASWGAVRRFGVEDEAADVWDAFLARLVRRQTLYQPAQESLAAGEPSVARLDLYQRLLTAKDGIAVLDEAVLRDLSLESGGDLMLVAVPRNDQEAVLWLYGRLQGRPDRIPVKALDDGSLARLVDRLSTPTRVTAGWPGLLAVDTAHSDFPLVLDLFPRAPAGTTIQAGDRIRAVEGRPVASHRDLEAAFAGRASGQPVPVSVERNGAAVEAVVITLETPVFPRPGGSPVWFNKYLADMAVLAAKAEDDRGRGLAMTGIGVGYWMAGQSRLALQRGFLKAALPAGAGVSRGTVAFFIGLCREALGGEERVRAQEAFREASQAREATLWRDDGPLVAPLARAHLQGAR
ncbi:MAG: PEGA domain-containing protein [Acidobacteriota bacterium]